MWWLPILLLFLLYRVKFIRLYLNPKFNWIGLHCFWTIYTFGSKIQTDKFALFSPVLIRRFCNRLEVVHFLSPWHKIEIPLYFTEPGFCLKYLLNDRILEVPFEEGTPFRLNRGELVLYKRVRRGLGFVMKEVARSKEWPFEEKA